MNLFQVAITAGPTMWFNALLVVLFVGMLAFILIKRALTAKED